MVTIYSLHEDRTMIHLDGDRNTRSKTLEAEPDLELALVEFFEL